MIGNKGRGRAQSNMRIGGQRTGRGRRTKSTEGERLRGQK
jgi:hypothetical protein